MQSADIPTDQNKAAAIAGSRQVGRQASRQVATVQKEGKEMDGCSQKPTDRPGPTYKTTASYLLVLFFYSTGQTPSRVNQYPPTGSANWPGNIFVLAG